MEMSPIPCLHTKLPPGVKILICGPIKVVNKVLYLEAKNVKVLGGEVDTLLITNAYENIILKALNEPLTAKPKRDYYEPPVTVEPVRRPHNIAPKPMPLAKPQNPKPIDDYFDDSDFDSVNLDNLQGLSTIKPQKPEPIKFDEDMLQLEDEILKNLDKSNNNS